MDCALELRQVICNNAPNDAVVDRPVVVSEYASGIANILPSDRWLCFEYVLRYVAHRFADKLEVAQHSIHRLAVRGKVGKITASDVQPDFLGKLENIAKALGNSIKRHT